MHSVSKNLQRDEEPGERDPKQRPLQGAFLIPPVLPVVLINASIVKNADFIERGSGERGSGDTVLISRARSRIRPILNHLSGCSVMAGKSSNSRTSPGTCRATARLRIFRAIYLIVVPANLTQLAGMTSMTGSVKFTSGKTCPAPIVKPKPHETGLEACPKTRSWGSGKAGVE